MSLKRTERQEIRLSPEEKAFISQAAEKKNMTVSDFMRQVAVEMAKAIALNKSVEETYHALIMGVGRVSPEVAIYAATADMSDYSPLSERKEGNEDET